MATGQQTSTPQSEFHGRTGTVVRRLQELHPKLIDLSLDRLEVLLARLGHPERSLPPTIHVAGTNGKGSTCANLRAIGEAAGLKVHVMTSPHLLSVTERFRLAGQPSVRTSLSPHWKKSSRSMMGPPSLFSRS